MENQKHENGSIIFKQGYSVRYSSDEYSSSIHSYEDNSIDSTIAFFNIENVMDVYHIVNEAIEVRKRTLGRERK